MSTDVVTHRITDITKAGLIHTKGDANRTADVWEIRPNQVRGAVVAGIPFAGYVAVYLQQPAGVASVITAVLALMLLWGLWFSDASSVFLTADEVQPAGHEAPVWELERSWIRRIGDRRPRHIDLTRPQEASSGTAAAAKVAVAGMLAVNLAGGLTVLADHSPAPGVSAQAAAK